MNTLVGDFGFTTGDFRHGVSVQAGQLADQDDTDEIEGHYAAGLYSEGTVGALDLSAQFVHYDLDEVDGDVTQGSGQKAMVNVGTDVGSWYTYSDLSMSMPDSDIADDDQIDLVLGGRYNYGPGNIYVEVLLENLTDDEDVETNDEFSQSIDLTMDYYF
ncbi:hypothetical protein CKO14_12280 [Halorhodospira halophila]|nr:hypothetical protein [Halorhodospira halophila]